MKETGPDPSAHFWLSHDQDRLDLSCDQGKLKSSQDGGVPRPICFVGCINSAPDEECIVTLSSLEL